MGLNELPAAIKRQSATGCHRPSGNLPRFSRAAGGGVINPKQRLGCSAKSERPKSTFDVVHAVRGNSHGL